MSLWGRSLRLEGFLADRSAHCFLFLVVFLLVGVSLAFGILDSCLAVFLRVEAADGVGRTARFLKVRAIVNFL